MPTFQAALERRVIISAGSLSISVLVEAPVPVAAAALVLAGWLTHVYVQAAAHEVRPRGGEAALQGGQRLHLHVREAAGAAGLAVQLHLRVQHLAAAVVEEVAQVVVGHLEGKIAHKQLLNTERGRAGVRRGV